MKKLLSLLLATMLCLTLVSTAMADDTVEIDFWCHFGGAFYEELAAKFMAANPNVKVNVLEISFWDYGTKLNPSLVAGTAADIFVSTSNDIAMLAKQNQIAAIDEYLPASDYNHGDFLESTVASMKAEGKQYSLPLTLACGLLYYNRDLFTAAGLDPDMPPKTWDEVYAYAEKITKYDDKGNVSVAGFLPLYSADFLDTYMLGTYGVTCMEGEKPMFNTPAGVKCFEDMLKFQNLVSYEQFNYFNEMAVTEYSTTNIEYFGAGKVGMLYNMDETGVNYKKNGIDLNWSVCLLPVGGDNTQPVAYGNGYCYSFTNHGAARLQAAVDFGAFLTKEEQATAYAATYGALVANNAARAAHMASYSDMPAGYWETVQEALAVCQSVPNCLEYPSWRNTLHDNFVSMFAGTRTAAEALAEAERVINQEVANYHLMND